MTEHEIRRRFPNASQAFIQANQTGSVAPHAEPKRSVRHAPHVALLREKENPTRRRISLVSYRKRLIESCKPTIMADEYDTWLVDNEEMRGLLNAGHRRGGAAYRCEGDNNEVRKFSVFAPAVLAGLGSLPGTLYDRSIVIRLERAKPGELHKRFDSRHTENEQELCRKLARFCQDNTNRFAACDPALPNGAFNRLADNWRPLFAIAEVAGGDWPQRAASAYACLTSRDDVDGHGIGTMLLSDIEKVFAEPTKLDRIFSSVLIEKLVAMSDRPWPEANRGRAVTETWLARRLRPFGIQTKKLRIPGEQPKQGYFREDFCEAFARYLPAPGQTKWNTGTTPANIGDSEVSEVEHRNNLFQFQKPVSPNKYGHCSTVPLEKAGEPKGEAEIVGADVI